MIETYKFGFKLFADLHDDVQQSEFVPIFHQWIRTPPFAESFIDVADYKHVAGGPGVMLIAQGGHYAMDQRGGRLGVAYKRLRPFAGTTCDAARDALLRTLSAAQALEVEGSLAGRLRFTPQGLECVVYDGRYRRGDADVYADFSTLLEELLGVDGSCVQPGGGGSAHLSAYIRWPEHQHPTPQSIIPELEHDALPSIPRLKA